MKIEYFQGQNKQWYFIIRHARNGKILSTSKPYVRKRSCHAAMDSIAKPATVKLSFIPAQVVATCGDYYRP